MENCTVNLYGRVEFGHIFVIAGASPLSGNSFKINFTDGGTEIPLTIFVNLRLKEIVLNSFLNAQWLETSKTSIPFLSRGSSFKLYILIGDSKFHIAINGQNVCEYHHYTPVENIRSIVASGDLEEITQVDHRRAFPSFWPPSAEDFPGVAFSSDVPYEFSPGSLIVMKMRVTGSPSGKFYIRFNERATERQLFHVNPRFADRVVVVNTMIDNIEWSKDEKRFTKFPFRMNQDFQLAIAMTRSSFKVAVDGNHILAYDYKLIHQAQPGIQRVYGDHDPIFEKLTGFKIFAENGMRLFVTKVSNYHLEEDCSQYENFTHPSYA